jgi:hypothetical protein
LKRFDNTFPTSIDNSGHNTATKHHLLSFTFRRSSFVVHRSSFVEPTSGLILKPPPSTFHLSPSTSINHYLTPTTKAHSSSMAQPNQMVERECAGCSKFRGLTDFSYTQRKKGDDAVCKKCIPEIQNVKAGHLSQEWDESDDDYMIVSTYPQRTSIRFSLTKCRQRLNASKISTTGSVTTETGGVVLPAAATFTRTTAASTRIPTSSVTTKTASSSRISISWSTYTGSTYRDPNISVGASGFVKIKNVSLNNRPYL